ncbi:fungal specific transcription factor [Fusarium albosuccineum]|uniref:Fungal specific transcription factor n=1 Tax=Fusarium albosuccineum TaxID=1237068 RepID=A0A8H4LCS6_9HYPO|nr:fungal specific transcription factor [Fusarium albosuccineum]
MISDARARRLCAEDPCSIPETPTATNRAAWRSGSAGLTNTVVGVRSSEDAEYSLFLTPIHDMDDSLPQIWKRKARVASLEEQLERLNRESHGNDWQHAAASGDSVSIHRSDMKLDVDSFMTLPALDEIMPRVELFFQQINPFVPLFDEKSFFRILMDWYTAPAHDRNQTGSQRAVFAAINVVLALAHRMPQTAPQETTFTKDDPERGAAESAASHRSAVQLCCRLFLNDREENAKHTVELKFQRERVFWITYVLDRDISMRYHTSPLLPEGDIDVDLPDDQPISEAFICSPMSHDVVQFSYFKARIQLAIIQGELYKRIYSNSATPQKLTSEQRRARMFELGTQLETWRRSIPEPLQAEGLVTSSYSDGTGPFNGTNKCLIVVLANMFYCDDLNQLEKDQKLTEQGLVTFAKLREASNWQPFHQLHSVVLGLNERATQDVTMKMMQTPVIAAIELKTTGGVAGEGINTSNPQEFSLEEWNFSDDIIHMI